MCFFLPFFFSLFFFINSHKQQVFYERARLPTVVNTDEAQKEVYVGLSSSRRHINQKAEG